jgi:hypothetical protein
MMPQNETATQYFASEGVVLFKLHTECPYREIPGKSVSNSCSFILQFPADFRVSFWKEFYALQAKIMQPPILWFKLKLFAFISEIVQEACNILYRDKIKRNFPDIFAYLFGNVYHNNM